MPAAERELRQVRVSSLDWPASYAGNTRVKFRCNRDAARRMAAERPWHPLLSRPVVAAAPNRFFCPADMGRLQGYWELPSIIRLK